MTTSDTYVFVLCVYETAEEMPSTGNEEHELLEVERFNKYMYLINFWCFQSASFFLGEPYQAGTWVSLKTYFFHGHLIFFSPNWVQLAMSQTISFIKVGGMPCCLYCITQKNKVKWADLDDLHRKKSDVIKSNEIHFILTTKEISKTLFIDLSGNFMFSYL